LAANLSVTPEYDGFVSSTAFAVPAQGTTAAVAPCEPFGRAEDAHLVTFSRRVLYATVERASAVRAPAEGSTPRSHVVQVMLYCPVMAVSQGVDLGTLTRVGVALADPIRRAVLVRLVDGPAYPAELADEFGTTRTNLSNHLACLRECGLVVTTAEGRRVRYDLADARLGDALRLLAQLDLPGVCE
jgi:ArsR family transcriptional regulator, cadmium/lead-responsive transcriptional repressor